VREISDGTRETSVSLKEWDDGETCWPFIRRGERKTTGRTAVERESRFHFVCFLTMGDQDKWKELVHVYRGGSP